jgi:5,10-methylenetetrahydromethanopterin reductase
MHITIAERDTVRAMATASPTFGLRIPPCRPANEVAEFVGRAEGAGFDVAWLPDSQFLWRDVWASLALAATVTTSIRLGTCVTNFETRHPSVSAAAAGTLAELAPERVLLGVGTGDSSIKTLGLRPTPLVRMREQIGVTRALLRGEPVDFEGRSMKIEAAPESTLPVYMAANAPKALALAGELCDGVILVAGVRPEALASALERVAEGAARSGRALADLEVCAGAICHVTNDPAEAAHMVRPYVVALAQTGGQAALRAVGIEIDPPPVVAGIYPDVSHAKDWDAAATACEEWVSDEVALRFADAYCLVGSAEHCAERLEGMAGAGATSFYIRHVSSYTLPEKVLAAFGESVIPRFRVAV